MKLTSNFDNGAAIAKKHTGEGDDASPPLSWIEVPDGTKSFALICDDPDAPSPKRPAAEPWVHWVIYDIPAHVSHLPESIAQSQNPSEVLRAKQGCNSWPNNNIGYRGPMPPPGSGSHRYVFRLFALDSELGLDSLSTDKNQLVSAMQGHVLAEAQLVGTYERE